VRKGDKRVIEATWVGDLKTKQYGGVAEIYIMCIEGDTGIGDSKI
jgi:hypothetical protein